MAEMVWCQSCKKVVWAYDHQPSVDLRGICNMLKLPCPKCGEVGNFDGWSDRGEDFESLKNKILDYDSKAEIHDWWSMMSYLANWHKVSWEPSSNNQWFSDIVNAAISNMIRAEATNEHKP